ncbi:alpha/beta hydrolase [Phenylobacterium sp.]|uniref:alpha/beta hydrolase n=1 Tax=Phenylobacterium sp. TaxID=1871053 RepID=UPI002B8C8949|nr:alpha/beta fold hydrolase [Phenylobacterium sp.]HLZ73456.1 alpha/beta fold hydrolase [Phenylobacterium sp.]
MRSGFAPLACAGVLALAWPTAAPAQRTISLGGSAPDAPFPLTDAGPKVPAVDPATLQGLPSARDYRPPDGIGFKAADFVSENVRLTAQWFWADENDGKKLPTVIVAPGWGATAATARQDAVDLARAGYRVMLFDYRGWGESDGRVMLTGARPPAGGTFTGEVRELRGYIDPREQVEDWSNAFSYAAADPLVDAQRIGVLGSDLAGGHVIYAAAFEPRIKALVSQVSRMDTRPSKPFQADPARVIAEADAAASRLATGEAQYPAEPARPLLGIPVGNKVARWTPIDQAEDVTAPALFVLAQKEELFSNTHNGQLACEEVKGPRKMVMLPEATHYDIYVWQRTRAINAAIDWFDRYLKPPGAPTRVPLDPKQPARGDCNPPPPPPSGDSDKNGSGEGHKSPPTSGRFN